MNTKTTLLLGLGAMIFGGCYSGVADDGSGGGVEDRWGKSCYYSYSSDRSASYTAESSDKGVDVEKTDGGFTLTMKADATAAEPKQMQEMLQQMRLEAATTAQHHIGQTCWEAEDIAQSCMQTCEERGLKWNEEAVVCDDCKVYDDGTIKCEQKLSPQLKEALAQPWYGEEPWFYTDEKAQLHLIMMPPQLTENWNGELVWVAEVEVTGFCLCACTAG